MSSPYGYGGVMGNQMGPIAGAPNQGGAMGPPNSLAMSAMMPPPPPPPPQGMTDYTNGMVGQVSSSMQQNMGHGAMAGMPSNMGAGMGATMGGTMGGNMSGTGGNMLGGMMGQLQPPPPPPVNPATNDAPLDFNVGRNGAPTPMSLIPPGGSVGDADGITVIRADDMKDSGGGGGGRRGDGREGREGSRDSGRGDRDREGGRDRDRDRENRDRQRGRGGRDRDRERERSSTRSSSSVSRDRGSDRSDRSDRDSGGGRREGRRRDAGGDAQRPASVVGGGGGGGGGGMPSGDANRATPMEPYNNGGGGGGMATVMDGQQQQQQQQQFNQMGAPWGPMAWNPMGGAMPTHMNPMGQMTPMGGPMAGGPVGPMGPMTPMGPMAGPMEPGVEAPPITGDFRITWGMFGWMLSPEGLTIPVKNSMQCKECTLLPPNRLAPPPTTRERPLGCRTVFVGGLPETVTEEMVADVFKRCGEITTVRLSKKNFAHIRYELEEFVENAIFLSGFRMRVNNSTDTANTGRLHVDYAQARDDLYEWECLQRALQREQRHRERMEAERLRPPSPPPLPHYTEHEASTVADHLKGEDGGVPGDETFNKAAATLVTWLERGDCTKRNTGTFYSMIQSTNSQVRRLMADKIQYEDELSKFREQTRARMQGIMAQFSQIERVFTACSQQKVWDHFTKAQRRNIEMWKKQAQEIKRIQLDDSDKEDADEMEVSDDEVTMGIGKPPVLGKKRGGGVGAAATAAAEALKEENDSLRCQLEAYKNEVDMVKLDLKTDVNARDEQISVYKKTLAGMQQTLAEGVMRRRKEEAVAAATAAQLRRLQTTMRRRKEKQTTGGGDDDDEDKELIYEDGQDDIKDELREDEAEVVPVTSTITSVDDKAAWLIGLTSTFLHIHPKGASVDYIWSYIQQFDKEIRPQDVESLLNQFPSVYKQITTGIGACLERKWIFTGFRVD